MKKTIAEIVQQFFNAFFCGYTCIHTTILPPTATPFLPLWAADPTDLTFSQLKKKFGGGKSKKCKSQGWWGGAAFGWQTAGLGFNLSRYLLK
jgi:hypothetical protein